MRKTHHWKKAALPLLMTLGISLSIPLPIRADRHEEREENERIEAIWREVRETTLFKDSLRTIGQPDPYGWFRRGGALSIRVMLADSHEGELISQTLPLDMQQLVGNPPVPADDPSVTHPQPQTGEMGITETVAQIIARDQSGPPPVAPEEREPIYPSRANLPQNPLSPYESQFPFAAKPVGTSSVPVRGKGGTNAGLYVWNPISGIGWNGSGSSDLGVFPPDSVGAAGPTQIVHPSNSRFRVFDKTGAVVYSVDPTNFFSSVINGSSFSDPRVRFDKTSNRWFIVGINVSSQNRIMIAVSSGPVITGLSSFTFFFIPISGQFLDYPTLGVDKNALYIGGNMFNTSGTAFLGCNGYVIRKSSILGSGPIVYTTFANLCTGSGAGPYTPQGVNNDDPNATEGYFVGVDNATFGTLMIRRVSNPGGTPTISANIPLTVNATAYGSTVPSQGSSLGLANLDDRLFDAQMHINRLTGVSTLWAAHNIGVSTTGVAASGGRNGSRWYQIGNMTATPTLVQSGTVFDSSATAIHYWIPGMMMNGQGHAILGSSSSSSTKRAEASAAARLSSDTLGTTRTPITIQASSTAYDPRVTNPERWGDYSSTFIDPADDMTFWTFQEYCNATNSWAVRVVKLLAPAPAAVASISPTSIAQGATANITVTGTSSDGTGYFDPNVSGYPDPSVFKRLAAAFSGTGLTVNSITFTDPTHITLNVTASASASTGTRNLTITNPDGQAVTANNILTVNAAAGTVSGTITLQSIVNSAVPITFEFRPQPSGSTFTQTATLNASGGYSLSGIAPGTYNVGIKGSRWLRTTVNSVVVAGGGTVTVNAALRGGDATNDNAADINDLLVLIGAYNQVSPAAGYSAAADFNNDGSDDIADLLILIANYNVTGDP